MLVSDLRVHFPDAISSLIASVNGNNNLTTKIKEGVYQIGSFGGTHFLPDYEHYPELSIGPYGVCDNPDQILAACPEIEASDRKFLITITPVEKCNEPDWGGWRWHKWGDYIGTQTPTHEYLYDEPIIDLVYCYHIYEKKS